MTQFLPAIVPARDVNGKPAAQAKWKFYYENTLTSAPLTSGGSEIIANSSGEFSEASLAEDITYRAVLKTADGRVISDITTVVDRYFAAGSREALDGTGLLPGARWEFFTTGTDTPRAVYADAGLTTSLGPVITADGAARFPETYLDPAVTYKAILKRPNGTTVATIEPVNQGTMLLFLAGVAEDGTYVVGGVVYGDKIGPKGPKQVLFGVWNQASTGYCHETGNLNENLYAKWASRGINTIKAGHPDFVFGNQAALLEATKANNLMLVAAPRWDNTMFGNRGSDLTPYDLRSLALTDPYWRTNWISYSVQDEPDLFILPLADHVDFLTGHALGGQTKMGTCNLTRRMAVPAGSDTSPPINYHDILNVPAIKGLSIDSYEWHLDSTSLNSATVTLSSPQMLTSTFHGDGIYDTGNPATTTMLGRRFAATITGMAVHLLRNGPLSPGRSDTGALPVQYPPPAFNTPPFSVYGQVIPPINNLYAPGDKWQGHYVSTSRVEIYPSVYGRAGQWQPGRFLRNEAWSGFTHGSSACYIFPQTVGTRNVTGYIDATANTLVVTTEPPKPFLFGGGLGLRVSGDFTRRGFIRKSSPQLSGTPGGAGTYALDTSYGATVATGSSGTPVTIEVYTMSSFTGDDSNEENLTELATIIANVNRMQAHPTGGNLLIDPVNGGRRAFTVMRCPDIAGDTSLYREDMTLAPIQPGYTSGGVAVLDDAGRGPQWDFGWPMGFEGFRVVGDDGATYIYVRSISNSNRPTWFPGYAALGLEARVFRAFELVGYRRVGSGAAVEMTGTSAVLKAGVDDGPATWFYIETAAISQNEGNSGNTAYNIIVRRGGDLTGTNTVTATVSGTGFAPANATDFGGSFPSQVLTFNPSDTTKTFTVNVSGDTTAELDETFKVTLSSPSTGTALVGSNKSEIACTITNDDAALVGSFVWLVDSLTSAPSLSGAPAGGVHLRISETTNVTRGGITMRSTSAGPPASDTGGFASTPFWQPSSNFHGAEFTIPAGNWEFAYITTQTFGTNTGTVRIIDDPAGAANVRYSSVRTHTGAGLVDTDGTQYTNASTALGDCLNNLTYVPVTVTNIGGGNGLVKFEVISGQHNVMAIALRQV